MRRRLAISICVTRPSISVFHKDFFAISESDGEIDSTINLLADMSTYLLEVGGSVELCDQNGQQLVRIEAAQLPTDPSEIN